VVVIVAVMVLASVGFAALLGRPRHDSIAEHQRAIDTLRDIAEHAHDGTQRMVHDEPDPTDHVQLFSEPPDGRVRRARSSTRSGPMPSSERRPRPDYSSRPTVANLPTIGAPARPGTLPASSLPQGSVDVGSHTDPAPEQPSTTIEARRFVDASRNRFGPARRTLAGVTVLAAIAASAVAATHISGSSRHHLRTPPAALAPRRTSTPRTSLPRPSTTTAARQSVLRLVLTSGGDARLDVTFPVTLTLRATQPCWVLASSQAGPALYTGTLQAGQQQQISVSAPFALRLGNSPGIALFVNNLPVSLAGVANTATLTFAGT
jgi:hypothetical protein